MESGSWKPASGLPALRRAYAFYVFLGIPMTSPDDTGAAFADLAPAPVGSTLAATLADRLREMIIEGELAPGTRLNERALCDRLGASRTPLREAFRLLAAEHLVELQPNRGAQVVSLSDDDIRESFEVMGALEALAGELACRHITADEVAEVKALTFEMLACHARRDLPAYYRLNRTIHDRINAAARNALLRQVYTTLNLRIQNLRFRSNFDQFKWDKAAREHAEMIDALEARDGARDSVRCCATILREKGRGGARDAARQRSVAMNAPDIRAADLSSAHRRRGPGAPASRSTGRRRALRSCVARPLFDRCVDLPDRAGRRRGARVARRCGRNARIGARVRGAESFRAEAAVRSAGRRSARRSSSITRSTLNRVLSFDRDAMTVTVEPGIVLDALNAWLRPHGVWFPVDVSPRRRRRWAAWPATTRAARARSRTATWCTTWSRSTHWLADGTEARFGPERETGCLAQCRARLDAVRAVAERERDEIDAHGCRR
jgi:DNA-binding GntR family transcriptional regulator